MQQKIYNTISSLDEIKGEALNLYRAEHIVNYPNTTINIDKSCISNLYTSFLGFRIKCDGQISIHKDNILSLKNRVRLITKRNRPWSLHTISKKLSALIRGWFHYFKIASAKRIFREIDAWIRRRIRAKILKYCKRKRTIFKLLAKKIDSSTAASLAFSNKGIWRLTKSVPMHRAYRNKFFLKYLGLVSLKYQYEKKKL